MSEVLCAEDGASWPGAWGLLPLPLLGYFEGIDSERGIAWRVADSLSLRDFLGLPVDHAAPDHSTLSKARKRISIESHREVFRWVLSVLLDRGLLKGKTIGVDATTLEANAAMKSIERRDDGRTYQEFLGDLAKASGVETPTRDDLARMDRNRKGKKTSNDDWHNPNDPDAQVTKMKDGRTHMGHKQEHGVDMDTGAIVAVTVTGGAVGDSPRQHDSAPAETEADLGLPPSHGGRPLAVVTSVAWAACGCSFLPPATRRTNSAMLFGIT